MLAAILPHAHGLGMDAALLTCDVDNLASRRVIEANGGILEDALLSVTELPHCGAVVRNTQTERAVRLINRLTAEMQSGSSILTGHPEVGPVRRA